MLTHDWNETSESPRYSSTEAGPEGGAPLASRESGDYVGEREKAAQAWFLFLIFCFGKSE